MKSLALVVLLLLTMAPVVRAATVALASPPPGWSMSSIVGSGPVSEQQTSERPLRVAIVGEFNALFAGTPPAEDSLAMQMTWVGYAAIQSGGRFCCRSRAAAASGVTPAPSAWVTLRMSRKSSGTGRTPNRSFARS